MTGLVVGGVLSLSSKASLEAKELISPEQLKELKENTLATDLNNGIRVVQRKNTSDVAALNFVLDWDRSDQSAGYNWDLHNQFVAGLMLYQTEKYSKDELNSLKRSLVSGLSCGPTPSCFNSSSPLSCQMMFPKENLSQALKMFSSVVLEPKFDQSDLDVLKKRSLVEIQRCGLNEKDEAKRLVTGIRRSRNQYFSTYYDLVPYVEKLTTKELLSTYKKFLNGKRTHITVVGSYDHDDLIKEIKKYFSSLKSWHYIKPALDYRHKFTYNAPFFSRYVSIVKENYPNVYANFYFKSATPTQYSSYYRPAALLDNILAYKFFEAMRVEKSLSYGPYAYTGGFGFSTSNLPEAMKVAKKWLEEMRRDPLGGEDVDSYKNSYYYDYYVKYVSSKSVASAVSGYDRAFHRPDEEFTFPQEIEEVDSDTMKFLAREMLRDVTMSFVGPEKLLGDLSVYEDYFDPPRLDSYP